MTPEIFIKEIEHYLDKYEIDIDFVTSNNIDTDNYQYLLWGNDIFDFYFGATRGCFIPAYSPSFVFKFDFNELWEEYCSIELEHYREAKKAGLKNCFAKVTMYDTIQNTTLYKYEYVDTLCRRKFREVTKKQIEDMNTLTSKHHAPTLPTAWTQNFIEYHGIDVFEKFLDFIVARGINDLHETNIGYIKDRPVVFDYAGFFEPSNSDCNS